MKLQGFVGPAYTLKSVNVDGQRCVNLYPELNEMGKGKGDEIAWLKSTPGTEFLKSIGTGPLRLVYVDPSGRIFVVSKNQLFYVTESSGVWSSTLVGEDGLSGGAAKVFSTTSGPISAASIGISQYGTGISTVFVDGDQSYAFLDPGLGGPGTTNFAPYSDIPIQEFPNASQVISVDGYFIFVNGTNEFGVSKLNDFSVDPLSFAAAEGDPDNIVGVIANQRDVWFLNERSTELFVNTGNADFPFERVSGGFIEKGCLASFSIAKIDNYVFWLGRDQFGHGIVYAGHGLSPERISTQAIETAIQGYSDPSSAVAYTYQSGGHSFYVLNFDEATWVYDLSTKLWHERAYLNDGILERHRAQYHGFVPSLGIHIVGDYENNNLYKFNDDYYTDNLNPILRLRASPHLSNSLNRIFYNKFQLDMETGVGLDGASTVQGHDPQVMLQFSDDAGHTWGNEAWSSAGKIGEYKKRVIWRRLGKSRDRIFRIAITDPVKVAIIGAEIEVQMGAS